jgi:XTP/dITP diphosphohydrolase
MNKLFIASTNRGKLKEIKALLRDLPLTLETPDMIGIDLEVEEDGCSYSENAALKAVAYARASGLVTLADDSGLEVEALGGLPGLRSARFSPIPGATDADRRRYLLQQLQGHPQPWKACFRCVVALSDPEGNVKFAQGECPGIIISNERGRKGFGFDPIFLLPELGLTMAELDMRKKNRLSHRARAIIAARPLLPLLFSGFAI